MNIRDLTARLARQVLRSYWNKTIPVDPQDIAIKMNVEVIGEDLNELSGQFTLNPRPVIRFNDTEPEVRQRFSIAHELGHYVLSHGDAFRDPARNFSATNYDPREVAANRFAAELLMPKEWISKSVAEGEYSIAKLAIQFFVSEAAMKYRLKNLGWLPT